MFFWKMVNIFWAPTSSNKNFVQFQKYKIEKNKKNGKTFGKQKNEKQIEFELFGHQKSSKSSDFLGDKKKIDFLEETVQKVQRFFFEKIKNGTF